MKEKLCWFMVFMVVIVGGCATGYTRIEQAPEIPFGEYQAIQVPDLKGSRQVPHELKTNIPAKIAKKLKEQKLFDKVVRNESMTGGSVLVCDGRIVQYDPGSRGMRWVAGPLLGTGKGSLIINMKFVDKASGKALAESNFEGEIVGGFLGGGFEDTYKEVAKQITQFIRSNF